MAEAEKYVALRQAFALRLSYLMGAGVAGVATATLDIPAWLIVVAVVIAVLLICIETLVRLWLLLREDTSGT